MIRSFVALTLPEEVRSRLCHFAETVPTGRVVEEDNLHLTLSFLGDQSSQDLQHLDETLSEIRMASFDLSLSGLDVFGGKSPSVLFLSAQLSDELQGLQSKVASAIRKAGIQLERRRFRPHVTLVRFGRRPVRGEAQKLGRFIQEVGPVSLPAFEVGSFALYRSDLQPDGPRYEALAIYPLSVG